MVLLGKDMPGAPQALHGFGKLEVVYQLLALKRGIEFLKRDRLSGLFH